MTASPTLASSKRTIVSWAMYDWANSAFATTIMATILPVYFASVAAKGIANADAYWGYSQTVAAIMIAVAAPFLGALADYSGAKKRFLVGFAVAGILASMALFFVGEGDWKFAAVVAIVGSIGFTGANLFYDAFLTEVAPPDQIDRVSALGYALGYVGGGILLAINFVMISKADWFGADPQTMTRWCFVSVGVWWLLFSIPLLRHVHDAPVAREPRTRSYTSIAVGRLATTLHEIWHFKDLFKFLIAFWLFNDGINTIYKMAAIYASQINIPTSSIFLAILVTQFVGIPFTIMFGWLAARITARRALFLSLWIYACITIFAYFIRTSAHFFALAVAVGFVQGGAQSLARSIYGSMVPAHKNAEFFSFFSLSAKFSAILGPLLFAMTSQATGNPRMGILSILFFFLVGIALLTIVDIDAGRRMAREALPGPSVD